MHHEKSIIKFFCKPEPQWSSMWNEVSMYYNFEKHESNDVSSYHIPGAMHNDYD